ncbi:MAG: nucleotidyltransferase domain-containing protein [Desulfobacterales bacterium]|nr:nucleotidyltransferase domain-containing protein [Deltaproteobacteria bacterium]NNL77615.1 nucleotidyltransferase domain-containing protein [Desulfobacterales bacterium]
MLSDLDKKVVSKFASAVRSKYPTARVWAFGSRARGKAISESDLDVCVVVDKLNDKIDATIMEMAWQTGFESDIVISTVTYSRQEFENGPCSKSRLVRNILDFGIAA